MSIISLLALTHIETVCFDLHVLYEDKFVIDKETHLKQLTETDTYYSTGLTVLDKLLLGGMKTGSIIEIIGPPASGKTQLVNTIAASFCEKANICYYIDTKMDFKAVRMERIVSSRVDNSEGNKVLERIKVQRLFSLTGLIDCLNYFFDKISTGSPKLLIIDSFVALCAEYSGKAYGEGQALIEKVASILRKLAIKRDFIILVTSIPRKHGNIWNNLPSHKVSVDRLVTDPIKLQESLVRNDARRVITLIDGPTELMTLQRKYVFSITDQGCVVVQNSKNSSGQ